MIFYTHTHTHLSTNTNTLSYIYMNIIHIYKEYWQLPGGACVCYSIYLMQKERLQEITLFEKKLHDMFFQTCLFRSGIHFINQALLYGIISTDSNKIQTPDSHYIVNLHPDFDQYPKCTDLLNVNSIICIWFQILKVPNASLMSRLMAK